MARRTRWVDNVISISTASTGQQISNLRGGLSVTDLQGSTITRLIVGLDISSNTVAGAWGKARFSVGIGLASEQALLGGSVPDPQTEVDFPPGGWLWRGIYVASQNGAGAPISSRIDLDLRAQRKLLGGQPFIHWTNTVITGTQFTIGVQGLVRMLVRLP